MDKIMVKGARFSVHIGVSEEERAQKQEIIVDMTLFVDTKKSARTDNIKDTIDYTHIYNKITSLLNEREYCLIESLGATIAQDILRNFSVSKIKVCVKKPLVLGITEYAAVELMRTK